MADFLNYALTNPAQNTVRLELQVVTWANQGGVMVPTVILDRTGASAVTATMPNPPAFADATEKQWWFDECTDAIGRWINRVSVKRFG